jgi:hypothetical protein
VSPKGLFRYVGAVAVAQRAGPAWRPRAGLYDGPWIHGKPLEPTFPHVGGHSSRRRRNTVADSSALTAHTMIVAPTADPNESTWKSSTSQLVR